MSDDKLAFQTISFFRLGADQETAEAEMPEKCSHFSLNYLDVGASQLMGPFPRKILVGEPASLIDVNIKIGLRTFLLEEKTYMIAVYLYQWNNDLTKEDNMNKMSQQKPDGVYLFSEAARLADQIHCMTDDNDHTYPEFRSIFQETPVTEFAGDYTMILNFCLIEWPFRVYLIDLARQEQQKMEELDKLIKQKKDIQSVAENRWKFWKQCQSPIA